MVRVVGAYVASPSQIADGVVTTSKLADGAVTTLKISDGAVTSLKISDLGVSEVDLADSIVTPTKINVNFDTIASRLATMLDDDAANILNIFHPYFIADIFNSINITGTKISSILASKYLEADYVQSILYYMVNKKYYLKLVDIMTAGASDALISAATTWTAQVNRYRNITIDAGVTLSLDNLTSYVLAYSLVNNGSIINVNKNLGPTSGISGSGGNGTGGIALICGSVTVGNVTVDGDAGGNGSTVPTATAANGAAGAGGVFHIVAGYSPGSGGNGGDGGASGVGYVNGGGGGGATGVSGGNGGSATTTSYPTIAELSDRLMKGIVDWYITNILLKTPTTTQTLLSFYGSAGGSGAGRDAYGSAGGGGGGAGEVIIIGDSVTAGTINVNGGAGGAGGTEGTEDHGGGGGGGSVFFGLYKTLTGTFTVNAAGGAAGVGDLNGVAGGAGTYLIQTY